MGKTKQLNFDSFMEKLIEERRLFGKERSSETYKASLRSLQRCHGTTIRFNDINQTFIQEYESFLRKTGVCPNTISFYMRKLRAAYNTAVQRGVCSQRNPFSQVYTGVAKTTKRAISTSEIRRIAELPLKGKDGLEFARDIFIFSFITRGMSLVDICYLTCSNLHGG